MKVKIDTREKFHVITILEPALHANMTADAEHLLLSYLQNVVKNVILDATQVETMDASFGEALCRAQQQFYDQQSSFVICSLQPGVEDALESQGLLELMNVTPTVSEASDIVMMEEIERELDI
jgi:anti-anti-sigma factor